MNTANHTNNLTRIFFVAAFATVFLASVAAVQAQGLGVVIIQPGLCSFTAFGEADPDTAAIGENMWFRSVAENISPDCTGKWVHEWDFNNDGTFDFTSPPQDNPGRGQDRAYGTAGTYKAVNRIRNVDSNIVVTGTPFTVVITESAGGDGDGGGDAGDFNPPSCPIPVDGGDILIDFVNGFGTDELILANKGFQNGGPSDNGARIGPDSVSIPAGSYAVQLASYDNHTDKPGQQQKKEQWFLRLRNASDVVVGRSHATPDLPEEPINTKYWTVNSANNPLVVNGHASAAYGFHALWNKDNPYPEPESVRPICAVLSPVLPEVPECAMDIEPTHVVSGGSATLSWTSKNADTAVIDHGIGGVEVNGSQEVGPISEETTYTGVFTGPGGEVQCEATVDVFTDNEATLTLVKHVINDDGGAAEPNDFNLTINTVPVTNPIAAQSGIAVVLPAGDYAVSEDTLAGYTAGVWGGDCTPLQNDGTKGTVTLAPGEHKTCTITNNDNQRPDGPTCPLTKNNQNDILIDFTLLGDSGMVANKTEVAATQGPVVQNVPADNYKVTLASFDGHTEHGGQNQEKEQWFLRFQNNGDDVLVASGVSDDIPEGVDTIETVVNENLAVPNGVTRLTARHADYPGTDGPQSLLATCALLEPLEEEEEEETNVFIEKSVTPSGGLIGTVFTYTLSYGNDGDETASDVTITDTPAPDDVLDTYQVTVQPAHNGNDPDPACSFTGAVLNCSLGNLEPGQNGTIEYTAVGVKTGTVDNTAIIMTPTPETVDENDNPTDNIDTARVSVTSGSDDTTDVGILKEVTPGSGKKFDIFTYTLTYENFGPRQAANVTIEDRFQELGILRNVKIIKQPEHSGVDQNDDACEVRQVNDEDAGIDCDLGTLVFGDTGTIVYEAQAKVDEATLKNIVEIKTTSDETNLANNKAEADISITPEGCQSNCGGGGGNNPDVVLFSNPDAQVLGASVLLAQVPYTGVGSTIGIILFFVAILVAAAIITYVVLKRRRAESFVRSSVMPYGSEMAEQTKDDALYQEYAHVPDSVSAPENLPVTQEVVTPVQTPQTYEASVLEDMARSQQVLLSQDAATTILAQAGGDTHKARTVLEKIIATARGRYPTEDGWLPLNRSRVVDILFASNLSTTPLFVQWLVEGNSNKVFGFLRSITKQGRAAEEFLTKILYELDSVYQARLEGSSATGAVAEIVASLSIRELEHMIESLTRAIDGGYSSGMTGAKVALARILDLHRTRKGDPSKTLEKIPEKDNIPQ